MSLRFPRKMPAVKLQQLSSRPGAQNCFSLESLLVPGLGTGQGVGTPAPQPASSYTPGDVSAIHIHSAAFKTHGQSVLGAKCTK